MATPWLESDNIDDYVKLYKPTCAEHAFKNHFDAFGEQNLTKIMLDYTEDSVIQVWNWSSNELNENKGLEAISAMFDGFWKGMAPDGWGKMEAPVQRFEDSPAKVTRFDVNHQHAPHSSSLTVTLPRCRWAF